MDLVDSGHSVAAAPLWTGTTRDGERLLLLRFAGAIAVLHIVGWGLFGYYSRRYPALAGLGTLAYTLGLRHALDADHIAAIDNTARKLLQEGKRPLGVGFFFSLGHSTVVFVLVAAVAVASRSVESGIASFRAYGSYLGAGISAVFLLAIAAVNSVVLLDILRAFREMKSASLEEEQLDRRLLQRGLMARFCLRHVARHINKLRANDKAAMIGAIEIYNSRDIAEMRRAEKRVENRVPRRPPSKRKAKALLCRAFLSSGGRIWTCDLRVMRYLN